MTRELDEQVEARLSSMNQPDTTRAIFRLLTQVRNEMAELSQDVTDLKDSISRLSDRLLKGGTASLQKALDEANGHVDTLKSQLDGLTVQDEADKKALADTVDKLTTSQAQAKDAATSLESDIQDLDKLGQPAASAPAPTPDPGPTPAPAPAPAPAPDPGTPAPAPAPAPADPGVTDVNPANPSDPNAPGTPPTDPGTPPPAGTANPVGSTF